MLQKTYNKKCFFEDADLKAFYESIHLSEQKLSSFWDQRTPFQRFAESGALKRILDMEIGAMATDPNGTPKLARQTELYLIRTEKSFVSLNVWQQAHESSQRFIFSQPFDSMVYSYGPEALRARIFERNGENGDGRVECQSLRVIEDAVLEPGSALEIPHRKTAVTFFPHASCVVLKYTDLAHASLITQYDVTTLRASRLISSNLSASRLQKTAYVLGKLGAESSRENLLALTMHEEYYVRWEALKAMHRIDPELGKQLLTEFTRDVHPHVRNAARKTIEMMVESRYGA